MLQFGVPKGTMLRIGLRYQATAAAAAAREAACCGSRSQRLRVGSASQVVAGAAAAREPAAAAAEGAAGWSLKGFILRVGSGSQPLRLLLSPVKLQQQPQRLLRVGIAEGSHEKAAASAGCMIHRCVRRGSSAGRHWCLQAGEKVTG